MKTIQWLIVVMSIFNCCMAIILTDFHSLLGWSTSSLGWYAVIKAMHD